MLINPLVAPLIACALAGPVLAAQDARPRFHTTRPSDVHLPLPEEDDAFTFVVFGDRTGGPDEGVEILAEAVDEVNLFDPDLVMTVGDLIQGYNTTPDWLAEMREYKGIMDRLDSPWFPVAGNHDVYWRGPNPPEGEHEANYETHFGPLWYAFEHKTSWFVVLYTDEGDPHAGQKAFREPAAQRMSPEQLAWLRTVLVKAGSAEHVFVFVHHPRWIGGGYGDDWGRVHTVLRDAGNVTAVFAGHIHHMRYDEHDGIEYYTLATVGGNQSAAVPAAGYLHQYHVVTVRPEEVRVAAFPVGSAFDPKKITGVVAQETRRLTSEFTPTFEGAVRLEADLSATGVVRATLRNPVSQPVEVALVARSDDRNWRITPDHHHGRVEPGEQATWELVFERPPGQAGALAAPELVVRADYLAESWRVPLPPLELHLPIDISQLNEPEPREDRVLALDGIDDHVRIEHEAIDLPDGPFTLEAWIRADETRDEQGIVTKTESSDYGLFLLDGKPTLYLHLAGSYVTASAEVRPSLGEWHHLAGTFDGHEARLYVDGRRVATEPGVGERTIRPLPLIVGADVSSANARDDHFAGAVDEVRLSRVARYDSEFVPARRHTPDADTALLLHFDEEIGPWTFDTSPSRAHGTLVRE